MSEDLQDGPPQEVEFTWRSNLYAAIIYGVLVAVVFAVDTVVSVGMLEGTLLWANALIIGMLSWFFGRFWEYSQQRFKHEVAQ